MLVSPKLKKTSKVKPTKLIKKGRRKFKPLRKLKSNLKIIVKKPRGIPIVKKQKAAITRVKPTVKKESKTNPVKTKKTNPSRNGSTVAKR